MRRNAIIASCLVVVASVIAWALWALWGLGGMAAVDDHATIGRQEAIVPPVVGLTPSEEGGSSQDARIVESGGAHTTLVPSRQPLAIIAGDRPSLEILVLDPHEAPVPGADVWVVPMAQAKQWPGRLNVFEWGEFPTVYAKPGDWQSLISDLPLWDVLAMDSWFLERGTRLRADEEGKVRYSPMETGLFLMMGKAEGLWNWDVGYTTSEKDVVLRLLPERAVRSRVWDPSGRTPLVGVDVRVLHLGPLGSCEFGSATTEGVEAIATLRHSQRWGVLRAGRSWILVPRVLAEPGLERILDQTHPPEEIVDFVLPATGAVEVLLLDAEGNPLRGEATVHLRINPEVDVSPLYGPKRRQLTCEAVEGRATFSHVALGLNLEAEAIREGSGSGPRVSVAGPVRSGEKTSITLQFGADHPVLQVRVVDADGSPLANERIGYSVRGGFGFASNMVTSSEGVLRCDLPARCMGGEAGTLTVNRGVAGRGEVDVPPNLEPGLRDLGTVILGSVPLLVSGRVVDATGEPVPGAEIALHAISQGLMTSSPFTSDLQPELDDQGRFKIWRYPADGALCLLASAPGYFGVPVEFQPGATGVVLQLQPGGTIAGQVIVDEWSLFEHIEIAALPDRPAVGRAMHSTQASVSGEDGRFEVAGLRPGTYSVRAHPKNEFHDEFAIVFDVEVRSGEVTRDPRLAPFDLRNTVSLCQVRVLDEAGNWIRKGTLSCREVLSPGSRREWGLKGAPIDLLIPRRAMNITVRAPGYRTASRKSVKGDLEIRLQPALPVRLVLRAEGALPQPPAHLAALLIAVASDEPVHEGVFRFDERGEVLVLADRPGRMKVQWRVEKLNATGMSARDVELTREQFIEVEDLHGEQTREVTLTLEDLEKLATMAK